jgi:hypothetical protein
MARPKRLPIAAMVALLLYLSIAGAAWLLWPRDAGRLARTADSLAIPATWELVHQRNDFDDLIVRAKAVRFYLVDAEPTDTLDVVKQLARAGGFTVYRRQVSSDWCDPHPMDSVVVPCATRYREDCAASSGGTCFVEAYRELDPDAEQLEHLWVSMTARGAILTVTVDGKPVRIEDPRRSLVTITVDEVSRSALWSSPTPRVN